MTPEILEQYLTKLRAANMMTFRMKVEGCELEGSFAPDMPAIPPVFGSFEPGGWKSPELDQIGEGA